MSGNEFTPGPWKINGPSKGLASDPCDDGGDYAIRASLPNAGDNKRPYILAEVIERVDYSVFAPAKANAVLIAAAPDLLEACKAIKGVLDERLLSVDQLMALAVINMAIAKATGENQ